MTRRLAVIWAAPRIIWAVVGAAGALLAPAIARGQITTEPPPPFPDPAKYARGLHADAEIGAVAFVGRAAGRLSIGPAVGVRVGYDVTRWLAGSARVWGSTHRAQFPGMPQDGQLLQMWGAMGEARLTLMFRQISLCMGGGGGMVRLSSNLLGTTGLTRRGVRNTPAAGGLVAFDYHTLSRRFSVGLQVTGLALARVEQSATIGADAYVRYTF